MIITSYTFVEEGFKERNFKIYQDPFTSKVTCSYESFKNGKQSTCESDLSAESLMLKEKALMLSLIKKDIPFKINVWEEFDEEERKARYEKRKADHYARREEFLKDAVEVDFDFHF